MKLTFKKLLITMPLLLIGEALFAQPISDPAAESQIGSTIIELASKMVGTPYVAGTLEVNETETLIINFDEVDCTTFVELISALALTLEENESTQSASCKELATKNYRNFTRALQQLRYRDGTIDGYASRMHYLSEAIIQGERVGTHIEITSKHHAATPHRGTLDFMSRNSHLYPHLKDNLCNISRIKEIEAALAPLTHSALHIPKDEIDSHSLRWVRDGDIIAITSGIAGLDILHVGFALWQGSTLHMLHASSLAGCVIIDSRPIDKQLAATKSQSGIRVIRLIKE